MILMVLEVMYKSNNQLVKLFTSASANETESHIAPEMSSTFAENIIEEQKVSNDEDNEAEIRQYLTLAQLGNILRELSVLGKTLTCIYRVSSALTTELSPNTESSIWFDFYIFRNGSNRSHISSILEKRTSQPHACSKRWVTSEPKEHLINTMFVMSNHWIYFFSFCCITRTVPNLLQYDLCFFLPICS